MSPKFWTPKQTWEEGQVLYRASISGKANGGDPSVRYTEYRVVKLTPCGAWLERYPFKKTWRSFHTYFVSTSKTQALCQLKLRVRRYVTHCRLRTHEAEARAAFLEITIPMSREALGLPLFRSSTGNYS